MEGLRSEAIALKGQRIITPLQDLRDAIVLVRGGMIEAVGLADNIPVPDDARVIHVGSRIIVPGFMDIHNHGAKGQNTDDGPEAVATVAEYLLQNGTTSWLPTVEHLGGVEGVVVAKEHSAGGAEIVGVHMEGPFLAPKSVPGQEEMDRGLHLPSLDLFHQYLEVSRGTLKVMGIAPELPGAIEVIGEMRRLGVLPAIAHTKASYEQFLRAVEAGARHVTHAYNVMTGFHHRKPGVMGGVLTCDQVTAELISDGFHVSAPAMDVLIRCKGTDKIAVITDSTPLAGLPDGNYRFFGVDIVKKDGISRVAGSTPDQDNTMAGSEWPMNGNIFNLVNLVGVSLVDAIGMATLTPARIIDLDGRKGSLEPGKDADLVVIDERVNVYLTMVRGRIVYEADRG